MKPSQLKQKIVDFWNSLPQGLRKTLSVIACTFKWIYRVLDRLVRIVLLGLMLYAIAFTVVVSVLLYKGFVYCYDIYDNVKQLEFTNPEMSRYMEALVDSNPATQIKHRFVPLDSISPYLRKAVIASEDAGFYYHPGFDVRAIAEALDANRYYGKTKFGGSTITQQLAKNLFLSSERSWERKFKELAYALLMEKMLGKDRILELYLNYAQWGQNIFGCEMASQTYFKKSAYKLNLDQSINMAAVLASPGKHNPNGRYSRFMASRRSVIYQNMFPKRDSLKVDSLKALNAPPDTSAASSASNASMAGSAE
ncbi:MAG: monofunctional biosynthetic peptidoglycan transglycosylase [Fibrobacter sp.]|nr:monofunctional biosynthetic peptidoglycan transglycosylase [Fibrobacter sp.]